MTASIQALPFLPEFHEKVRGGLKTATARYKPYGRPGDRLQGPGCILVLEAVNQAPLGVVAGDCYGLEGLPSREAFVEVWNRIHPRKPFDPTTPVWLHRFHVEGSPPVCDAGWYLETPERRKELNQREGGWAPVDNGEAAWMVRRLEDTGEKA